MPALNYDYDYYEYRRRNYSQPTKSRQSVKTSTANLNAAKKTLPSTRRYNKVAVPQRGTSVTTKKVQTPRKQNRGIDIDIEIKSRATKKMAVKPKEMTLKKPKTVLRTKKKSSFTFKTILLIAVIFGTFFMICYRYSLINEKFLDLKKMKSELSEVQTVNEQLQADIENKTDLKYVENYAKYQLGMQKPSSNQIQYVTTEKEDKIMAPVLIEDESSNNFFENILREIRKFLD